MPLYIYLKRPVRKKAVFLPLAMLGGGLILLFLVAWPILTFELFLSPNLSGQIITPLSQEIKVLGAENNLTIASNWFPDLPKINPSKITNYTLSIPKLGIKDATVSNIDQSLEKHLVQWGGTGNPGQPGNTVVFGHSVLPAFFDPKNYTTIFSTLPTIQIGEEIFVYYDGITYKYQVVDLAVIEPKDISVLEQSFEDSYLSLVTCVPPGTYWKRLVVKARLVRLD